jgi:hypothetical protein
VIFHYRLKRQHDKRIETKLVGTDRQNAYTEDSVKYWVREEDGGQKDPTDPSKTSRGPSDFAVAVSKILNE